MLTVRCTVCTIVYTKEFTLLKNYNSVTHSSKTDTETSCQLNHKL